LDPLKVLSKSCFEKRVYGNRFVTAANDFSDTPGMTKSVSGTALNNPAV